MKCFRCQNDTFDKSIIFVKTLNIDSKYKPPKDNFQVFTCKKCHLTQWYDYSIVSKEVKPERRYDKSTYESLKLRDFRCLNCQSYNSIIEIIVPFEPFILFDSRTNIEWTGEILFRICTECGLVEMYEISLSKPMVHNILVEERQKILDTFICYICKLRQISQTGQISFWEKLDNKPEYKQERQVWYLFGTCNNCRYMMVYGFW